MALGDKPTDLPEWASGGSAQVTNPSAGKKLLGWIKEKPPYQYFNWLFYTIYTWLAFQKQYAETHTHDGLGNDHSAPKVSLVNHIDWGSEGEVEVITDNASQHWIQHQAVGGSTAIPRFGSAIIEARDHVRVKIRDPADYVEFRDNGGIPNTIQMYLNPTNASDHTGFAARGFKVEDDAPVDSDFATIYQRDSALYRGNLAKAFASITMTWNGSAWVATTNESYNVASITVGASYVDIEFTQDTYITPGPVGNVSTLQARTYVGNFQGLTGPKRVRVLAERFNTATNIFDNAISNPLSGEIFTIHVVVY